MAGTGAERAQAEDLLVTRLAQTLRAAAHEAGVNTQQELSDRELRAYGIEQAIAEMLPGEEDPDGAVSIWGCLDGSVSTQIEHHFTKARSNDARQHRYKFTLPRNTSPNPLSHVSVVVSGKAAGRVNVKFANPKRTAPYIIEGSVALEGAAFAECVAYALSELEAFADSAFVACCSPQTADLAQKLVDAGASCAYDDTGLIDLGGASPKFADGCVEVYACPSEWCDRNQLHLPFTPVVAEGAVEMTEELREALRARCLSSRALRARPPLERLLSKFDLTPSVWTPFAERQKTILELADVLSYGREKARPYLAEHLTPPEGFFLFLEFEPAYSEMPPDDVEAFCTRVEGLARIWRHFFSKSQAFVSFEKERPEHWRDVYTLADAIGIDEAIAAYYEGVPLEHVLGEQIQGR